MRSNRIFSLVLILITSCSPSKIIQPTIEQVLPGTIQSPNISSTTTPSPTPSPTPTPQTPVLIGTPFPKSLEEINKNNVRNLQNLVTFQNGHMLTRFAEDLEKLYIADQSGITVCKTKNSETFVYCESVLNHFKIFLSKNSDLAFSPGDFMITPTGSHFLAVTEKGLQVFNEQGEETYSNMLPEGDYDFALSPDGNLVSILKNNRLSIIRINDGEEVFSDEGSLAQFSADGKYLAVQKRMAVYLYSVMDWSNVFSFPQDQLDGWDISGNGEVIANINGKDLVIHRLSDGEYVKTIKRIGGGDVLLSSEGKFAFQLIPKPSILSQYTKQIRLWDIEKGEEIDEIVINHKVVGFSIYNLFIDGLDAIALEVVDLSNLFIGDDGIGWHFIAEKPQKSVTGNQKIYLTDSDDILLYTTYPDNPNVVSSESGSGELCLITMSSKTVCEESSSSYFFDQKGRYFEQIWIEESNSKDLFTCSFNKNAGEDSEIIKEDQCKIVSEGKILDVQYSLKALITKNNIALIQYTPDFSPNTRVIDLLTGEIQENWKGTISYPVISQDSRFVAFLIRDSFFSSTYRLGIYDSQENDYLFFGNENRPSSFSFTKENLLVGIINEKTRDGKDKIVAFDLKNKDTVPIELISNVFDEEPEIGRLNAIAFSPDESILISGTDKGYILVYDFFTKTLITRWQAFDNASILSVAFTRDSRNIITSSEFGEIKLWGTAPFEWNTVN